MPWVPGIKDSGELTALKDAEQQIKRLVSNRETRHITEACPRYEALLSLHDLPTIAGMEQKRELSAPKI